MRRMLKILMGLVFLTVCVAEAAVAAAKDETTYEKDVKKIIAERCLSCHGSDAPTMEAFKKNEEGFKKANKGPRTDTYANLMVLVNGSSTGALMRRLDDGKSKKDGKPGNMYRYLGGTEQERAANLSVFKNWVGGWTLKRKAEITGDELKAIKALEK
ncbi:MAG: cytochrome C [Deltaproteobacteria bacterium]|nr:cytochrome C [Deltaproteobacteria bacterium]